MPSPAAKLLAMVAATLSLAACTLSGDEQLAGNLRSDEAAPTAPSQGLAVANDPSTLAAAHKANPSDPAAAAAYAQTLRLSGAKAEALAVLERASLANPRSKPLQLQRGLLALDLGDTAKAEKLLRLADDGREWRVYSGLGAAFALAGKQKEAQQQFTKALALAPDNPVVLNNLALSYALSGNAEAAERLLRKAHGGAPQTPSLKQNLALVLGLRGKHAEARAYAPADARHTMARQQTLATGSADPAQPTPPVNNAALNAPALPQPTYQLGRPPSEGASSR